MHTRTTRALASAGAVLATLSTLPTLAHAEDANPLSFNIGVFSEYRYRGISQTRFQPALQGGADYALANGLYLGTWLSNIKWIKDAENAAGTRSGGDVEWDLYAGYKGEIVKDLGFDVGVLRYQYPGNHLADVPGSTNANTTEVYGGLSYGPASLKYSYATTSLFGFRDSAGTGDSKGSGYLDLSASFDVMGFSLVPHVGYQDVRHNSDFSYTDYSLTASKDFEGFVVSVAVVGADTKTLPSGVKAYASPANGKDLGRAGLVVGVKKTF
jgi:uncharacterized protein (TIGR02001 family)